MKKEDLVLLILALLLLAGMLFTIFFGGEESRHGVGFLQHIPQPELSGIIAVLSKCNKSWPISEST
jgi:hypothetical protein